MRAEHDIDRDGVTGAITADRPLAAAVAALAETALAMGLRPTR
jgi:hypothetical protein